MSIPCRNGIDVDSEKVIAALEALQYLVPHPRAGICIRADEDAGIAGVLQPSIDEPLERSVTLLLRRLQMEAS